MPEHEPILGEEDPIHQFFGDIEKRLQASGHTIRKLKEIDSAGHCDGMENGVTCGEQAGWEVDRARYCFEHTVEAVHLLDEGERAVKPHEPGPESRGYEEDQKKPDTWN